LKRLGEIAHERAYWEVPPVRAAGGLAAAPAPVEGGERGVDDTPGP
jgi:hypothetical protein